VAAAQASQSTILMTAVAGLVAGAMSMAAGEYVSVHSQADTEKADLERERRELAADPAAEVRELASIYVGRGLDAALAQQVAQQLMAHDALGAHARDELEISSTMTARPVQAALTSAAAFAAGAALPLAGGRRGARQQPRRWPRPARGPGLPAFAAGWAGLSSMGRGP
jgi:VIT1/CCC1 family predicted Fe2+/Mn2+ transporter